MVMDIQIVVDGSTEETLKEGVCNIIKSIKPDWQMPTLKSHVYTNGITNKLVGTWRDDKNDQILVRVSGDNTEKFIDRKNEIQSMELMHKNGCGPKVYAKFENGLAYSFIPGRPLTADCVNVEEIWTGISKAIANIHRIKMEAEKPQLFPRFQLFIDLLPPNFKEEQVKRLSSVGISKKYLVEEMKELQSYLEGLHCPTVISHNDIALQNIIWNEEIKEVSLIDFEYTFVNYQAFDIGNHFNEFAINYQAFEIGNHFNEFAGVETVDYTSYPSPNYQSRWVRSYLSHYHGMEGSEIEDIVVETMRVWANKFALASHMLWGTWALLQSHFSALDFDFTGYAMQRLGDYKKRKKDILSLKVPVAL